MLLRRIRPRDALLASALLTLGVLCCAAPDREIADGAWHRVQEEALGPDGRAQLERATAARDALFGELKATLTAEVQAQGPAGAIDVCRDAAPRIAAEVSARHGVAIGRTSWKLRNPDNRPPAWAEPLLRDRPSEPRLATDGAGRLGVTLPIRLAANCLACHGPEDELAPGVAAALAELYPEDRATGFAAGQLRGWFWVEVPG